MNKKIEAIRGQNRGMYLGMSFRSSDDLAKWLEEQGYQIKKYGKRRTYAETVCGIEVSINGYAASIDYL